jgi:ApbE superfamily uncharacterized protein (UPF0280 family)
MALGWSPRGVNGVCTISGMIGHRIPS